jgi:hypothetical protein
MTEQKQDTMDTGSTKAATTTKTVDTAEAATTASTDGRRRNGQYHGILGNLLTLLVAGVIIAGGFLLPTLLYPYIDRYRGEVIPLASPSEGTIAEHVFEEPVTLYPWNLYREDRLRPLSSAERSLLEDRGIPSFLIATLRDHGMPPAPGEDSYHTQIINSFRYLDPQDSAERGCFVLIDADIDEDNQADIRCAVDLEGDLISLLFISDRWNAVQVKAPIGVPATPPPGENAEGAPQGEAATEGSPEDSSTDSSADTEGGGTEAAEGGTGASTEPGAADAEGTTNGPAGAGTGAGGDGTTPAGEGDSAATAEGSTAPTAIEPLPVGEDQYLWSFIYATAREARIINQSELFLAFRQLELGYENRYGYPYTRLLPIQPASPENLPEVKPLSLTPTPFATADYLLYIYDLPTGERLILYLDPLSRHCLGFNLLYY